MVCGLRDMWHVAGMRGWGGWDGNARVRRRRQAAMRGMRLPYMDGALGCARGTSAGVGTLHGGGEQVQVYTIDLIDSRDINFNQLK
jgi:hypothetical protein